MVMLFNRIVLPVLIATVTLLGAPGAMAAEGAETRQVSAFKAIDVTGAIELVITVQEPQGVRIIADKDALSAISTEVRGETLYVHQAKERSGLSGFFNPHDKTVRCELSVPLLSSVKTAGASRVDARGLKGEHFELISAGASKATLRGAVKHFKLELSGASKVDAEKLTAEHAELDLAGASDVVVNAVKTLKIEAAGASHVTYVGNPKLEKDLAGFSVVVAK